MHIWIALVGVLVACGSSPAPARPASTAPPVMTCPQQVTSLRGFVERLELGDPDIAQPWPTGDAQRDRHIDELVTAFRAVIKPEEKGGHFMPLNMKNTTPGELERLYAQCPASLASLKKLDEVEPKDIGTYWHQAVDGLTTCDCHADLATLRAFYYLLYRGPF
jgi:hypothetical protein